MSGEEIFIADIHCRSCKIITAHNVNRDKQINDVSGVDYFGIPYGGTSYEIVVCRGCKTKSFRITEYRQKNHYKLSSNDDDIFSYDYELYPKDISWHKNDLRDDKEYIPANIYQLYCEVLSAIQEEAYILAAIGIRGIVEGICKDLGIRNGNLSKQIKSLHSKFYISRQQADLLHGIRFMGNDAVHDLAKPKTKSIQLVLEIVEHLINSIYVLKGKSKGSIETAISDYDVFEDHLLECIQDYDRGMEKNLRGWLEPNHRLFELAIQELEKELIENIKSGTFKKLKLGKIGGKDKNIQFYIKE